MKATPILIRITTIPISLEKLLVGQLEFMQSYFNVTAISADKETLTTLGEANNYNTFHVEMTRKITPWQDVKAVVKLYRYLKKERPELVHTHTPKAGIVGMLAARLANVPHRLHTVAGLPLMEATGLKRKVLNAVERLTYSCATHVYPNSEGLKDFILSEGLVSKKKIKIIGNGSSNGINTAHFNPTRFTTEQKQSLREELNIQEKDFVFVFVGRLVADKGINELVKAFKSISEDNKNIRLLLVGPLETELDPLESETLQEIETNLQVVAVGYQNDVRPYFAISDALVFPSYREGFPNVVMQAGAMGLPAIVSNINGCNEIIKNRENGVIIPVKNTAAIEEAMSQFLEDTDFVSGLKQKARPLIVERYEQSKVWSALLDEYNHLLKEVNS